MSSRAFRLFLGFGMDNLPPYKVDYDLNLYTGSI
jgi:hypothetical protein